MKKGIGEKTLELTSVEADGGTVAKTTQAVTRSLPMSPISTDYFVAFAEMASI